MPKIIPYLNLQHRKSNCVFAAMVQGNNKLKYLSKASSFFPNLRHLQKKHPQELFEGFAVLDADFTKPFNYECVIRQFNDLFSVKLERIKEVEVIVQVRRLNTNVYSGRCEKFAMEFQKNDKKLVKFGYVNTYKNTVNSYEDKTSLKGLLEVFGDLGNIKITINIEFYVACHICQDVVTPSLSQSVCFGRNGWCCLKCASIPKICTNVYRECLFEGNVIKSNKHSLFFCPRRNMCFICRGKVSILAGGPTAHYLAQHENITHATGATFHIKSSGGSYCLLKHGDDIIVCRYHIDNEEFCFDMRSPWNWSQLKSLHCYVTVTPVVNAVVMDKETKTCSLDARLSEFNDWRLDLKSREFKNWGEEVAVSVRLQTKSA